MCVRVPVRVRACVQQMYRWPVHAHRGDSHSLAQFLSAAQTVANGPSPGCIYRPFVAWVELIWRSKCWTWQAVTGFQHLTFISDNAIFPRWVHWRDCSIWHYTDAVSDLFLRVTWKINRNEQYEAGGWCKLLATRRCRLHCSNGECVQLEWGCRNVTPVAWNGFVNKTTGSPSWNVRKFLRIGAHSTKNQEHMKLCLGNSNLMVNLRADRECQMDVK